MAPIERGTNLRLLPAGKSNFKKEYVLIELALSILYAISRQNVLHREKALFFTQNGNYVVSPLRIAVDGKVVHTRKQP